MTRADLVILLPLIVPATGAVVALVGIAIRRSHRATFAIALAALAAGCALVPTVWRMAPRNVAGLIAVDGYGLVAVGAILAGSLAVALFSHGYLTARSRRPEEFYCLLLLATTGAGTLAVSRHFATFFLGLEILSVALFALAAYERTRLTNIEAGLKYLVLGGISSAFLLFGMALVYLTTGTLEMRGDKAGGSGFGVRGSEESPPAASGGKATNPQPSDRSDHRPPTSDLLVAASPRPRVPASLISLAGLAMILIGVGFKLSLVPFHLWTPDVYQGAPAPTSAFLSSVAKIGVFAVLVRFVTALDLRVGESLHTALTVLAIASMVGGNVLALRQLSVKRILAYSSIAHLGYILVALLAVSTVGVAAATYYLLAYAATALITWGVVGTAESGMRNADSRVDSAFASDALSSYRGLAWRRPFLGAVFTIALLSLAGIPLTGGFLGKFYTVAAGAASGLWLLIIVLVVTSTIGLYYYVRVIAALFARPDEEGDPSESARAGSPPLPLAAGIALVLLTLVLLWLGVYPGPFVQLLQAVSIF